MRASHTSPEEALRAFADVGGQHFVPIHWGTFDLAEEPLDEPPVRMKADFERRQLDPARAWIFKIGETRPW
jgi:L-ascorbate metabolism protein UlaG (beta-lactamase superfamily)